MLDIFAKTAYNIHNAEKNERKAAMHTPQYYAYTLAVSGYRYRLSRFSPGG